MRYEVVLSNQAEMDLRDIFQYIAFELQSLGNASAQLDRIETAIKGLDRMPERFPQYKKGRWRERNLRVLPVDHYCVFYVFDKTAGRVTVLRIMYSGRNMEKEL